MSPIRKQDLDILGRPYRVPLTGTREELFSDAIGARLPNVRILTDEILADLDTTSGGIGWWSGLSWARRVLISDHLISCALSVETNAVEARLHLLEAMGCWEENGRRFSRWRRDGGGLGTPP